MNNDFNNKYLKYKHKYLKLKKMKLLNQNNLLIGGGKKDDIHTLYLFKSDGCGHCIGFKPTWEALKKDLGNNINFVTYDAINDKQKMRDYKIEGYPTLMLQANNKVIEYVGSRDLASLKDFIKQYN